MTDALVFTKLF